MREKVCASFFFVKRKVLNYDFILWGTWWSMEAGQPPAEHRAGINSLALPRTRWVSPFVLGCTCLQLVPVSSGSFVAVTAENSSCLPVTSCVPNKNSLEHYCSPVPLLQQKLLNYFLQKPEQPSLPHPAGCNILTCRFREQVLGRSGFLWWTGSFWGQQQWRGKNSPIMSKGLGSHVDVPFEDL